ncbi:MAG TPA: indolepyruvate ferredoxin oxidoreductase subunit alpha [Firmicutes bacterium]|nr:indolepyruvate ferredoxin oxidoreductase subunit alpha [Bacillota bacterium]
MTKALLTGNEAIARGAYEYGVSVASAYPGTPSTEILENIANYREIRAQWSPNEKVALEVAIGASIAGARALCAMKHVGVNVAADPLFTYTYTGVNGGLVLVSADDPGMHSSQNEQDNRNYARFAKIGLLEPSDSQEAKDMVAHALAISERFDTPVMLRTTTRISHSKSLVELKDPQERTLREYKKDARKYVAVPANAKARTGIKQQLLQEMMEFSEETELNRVEWDDKKIGIVTSGIAYQYVKEALPNASILKLGFTNPLPLKKIAAFAEQVEQLWVVEELEPFMEEQIRAAGIEVHGGKAQLTRVGEYSPSLIRHAILGMETKTKAPAAAPIRPPVLCPGCPHRGVFYALRNNRKLVTGDIGCYTLGAMPPLESLDTTICMGASIPAALGMEKARPEQAQNIVAVIGDSTFLHSGITGLIDMVYNKGTGTVMILDNRITAMTGHQHHAGTGQTLQGEAASEVDFVALCHAVGVKRVRVVDPGDLAALDKAIKEETAVREPSVIIARKPCALIVKQSEPRLRVDHDKCTGCRMCMRLGCPAISFADRKSSIDPALCVGCGLCQQVCKFGAIVPEEGQ